LLAWSGLTSLGNIKTTLQAVSVNRGRKALDRYYSDTWKGRKVKVPLSSTARTMMLENMETFKELLNEVPIFTRQDAASVVQPTLIVTGEHTIRYMKAVALELNRIIPHNEMAVIRNAAHYPHLENPRECNAIISKFLSQNTDIV
jgi:pimeloyl-ACP methyl ester carboxylesterase